MAEVIWVGPGWYRKLRFAVGGEKVTQVSPNKQAQIEDAHWCMTYMDCIVQFEEPKGEAKSQRITY